MKVTWQVVGLIFLVIMMSGKKFQLRFGNPEEIIITDTENHTDLESLPINEYSSYSDIQELAEYIEYLQDDQYKEDLFIAVYNSVTSDFEEAKEAVEKRKVHLNAKLHNG